MISLRLPDAFLRLALLPALVVIIAPCQASAQLDALDKGELINTLRQEGMNELLLHYVETSENLDPVTAQLAKIAQLQLTAEELRMKAGQATEAEEQNRLLEEARTTIRSAFETQLKLAADQPDHPARPIWLTDAADLALFQILPNYYKLALQFDEFGTPWPDQKQAIAEILPAAQKAAAEADEALFNLFNKLGGNNALRQQIVNAGLNFKLEEYRDKFAPFYLAIASYHLARQDGSDATALLDTAIDRGTVGANNGQDFLKTASQRVVGGAMVRSNDAAGAMASLDEAYDAESRDPMALYSGLTKAEALAADNKVRDAQDLYVDLLDHPAVQNDPSFILALLVTDAMHKLDLAEAQKLSGQEKEKAIAAAYSEPYQELLSLDRIQPVRDRMRVTINSRWAETLAEDIDPKNLPAPVRVGIGEVVMSQAGEAQREGDPELAIERYDRVLSLLDGIDTVAAPDDVIADGLYYTGVAKINKFQIENAGNEKPNVKPIYETAVIFTKVARDYPQSRWAELAITQAMGFWQQFYVNPQAPPAWRQGYVDAGELLLTEYAQTAAAHDYRVFYVFQVHQQAGRYEKAAELYSDQPDAHNQFFEARRFAVLSRQTMVDDQNRSVQTLQAGNADGAEVEKARQELEATLTSLNEEAEALRERAEQEIATGNDQFRINSARAAVASSLLAIAEVAQIRGETDKVLETLDGFAERFGEDGNAALDVLIRASAEKRILALVEANRLDDAKAEAVAMVEKFEDAAAPVVNQALKTINADIETQTSIARQRRAIGDEPGAQEFEKKAATLGQTAVVLAELLVDWAKRNDKSLVPFEQSLARAYVVSGRHDDALALTEKLIGMKPNQMSVILLRAETMYSVGMAREDGEMLKQAAGLYDNIIKYFQTQSPDKARTAEEFWNSWARRYQIMDKLNVSNGIPISVKRLEQKYPDLGGPPWNQIIRDLRNKYATDG